MWGINYGGWYGSNIIQCSYGLSVGYNLCLHLQHQQSHNELSSASCGSSASERSLGHWGLSIFECGPPAPPAGCPPGCTSVSLLARSVQLAKRLATQPCDTGGALPSDPRTCCSFIGGGTHRVCKVIPRVTALGFSVNYDVKEAPTEVGGTKYLVKCRMDIQLLHIKIVQTFHADGFQATIWARRLCTLRVAAPQMILT